MEGVKYKTRSQILTNFYRQNSSKSILQRKSPEDIHIQCNTPGWVKEVISAKEGFQSAPKIAPLAGEGK